MVEHLPFKPFSSIANPSDKRGFIDSGRPLFGVLTILLTGVVDLPNRLGTETQPLEMIKPVEILVECCV